jgi:DNA-binding IclR family transcriptional regulator
MKRHSTAVQRRGAPARHPYPGTQAVLRAMGILAAFSDTRPEWGIADLARELGLHKTTAFRLLAALEYAGMIAHTAPGVYRLGPAAIALGAQALRSNDLRTVARAELVALAERSQETVTLDVLVGNEVLILDEVQSRYLLGSTPDVGWRGPAHATSTGKVLLAAARHERPGPTRRRTGPRGRLARVTPHTITSVTRLDRALDVIWKQGYATAVEELEPGLVAVGAPVRDHDGRVVAALSIAGPKNRLSAARITEAAALVRQAAAALSLRLGCPPSLCSPPL